LTAAKRGAVMLNYFRGESLERRPSLIRDV